MTLIITVIAAKGRITDDGTVNLNRDYRVAGLLQRLVCLRRYPRNNEYKP